MATTSSFRESQCFVWEISNFTQLNGKLTSPLFIAHSSKWKMAINAFEWDAVPSDRICVEISLNRISGENKRCCVHFDLFLQNSKKEYDHFDSFTTHLQYDACAWTMRYSELMKAVNELVPENQAKIICYIDSVEAGH